MHLRFILLYRHCEAEAVELNNGGMGRRRRRGRFVYSDSRRGNISLTARNSFLRYLLFYRQVTAVPTEPLAKATFPCNCCIQMRGCLQLAKWLIGAPKCPTASRFPSPVGRVNARRPFTTSVTWNAARSRVSSSQPVSDLEVRIANIPIERYRNFCIVAHVDHGKSTLSDRLLELTGTIQPGTNKQVLDKLDVERERGITVKAQTCTMIYNHNGEDYLLHLVDTPGHVDFRAEVSRSYASCGGALLLVDASQGVQAQTVANFYLAFAQGLELIPVLNKIDLPTSEPERALEQMRDSFELDVDNAVGVSAKTGLNVQKLLPTVVDKIPA